MGITNLILQVCNLLILFGLGIGGWVLFKHQETFKSDLQKDINKNNVLALKRIECISKIYSSLDMLLYYLHGFLVEGIA